MKRLIDWFRKPAIMSKLINTAGMFDGDFVVYKHHKYYVNCQTGVVIRVEQCIVRRIKKMKCAKCGGDIVEVPIKNNYDVEGYYYFCNKCNRAFWISLDGDIVDSPRILSMDLSNNKED